MLVWVLTENAQARRFYEKLGVELVCDQDIAHRWREPQRGRL